MLSPDENGSPFLLLHHEVTRVADVKHQRDFFHRGFEPDDPPNWKWIVSFGLLVVAIIGSLGLLAIKIVLGAI